MIPYRVNEKEIEKVVELYQNNPIAHAFVEALVVQGCGLRVDESTLMAALGHSSLIHLFKLQQTRLEARILESQTIRMSDDGGIQYVERM